VPRPKATEIFHLRRISGSVQGEIAGNIHEGVNEFLRGSDGCRVNLWLYQGIVPAQNWLANGSQTSRMLAESLSGDLAKKIRLGKIPLATVD
jgi:hypothetical protein